MRRFWDNPVARHAGRLVSRSGRPWAVVLLLLGACGLGAVLQVYWMELEVHSFLRPQRLVRWLGLTLVAEAGVALPWAAVRGALLWRRLERDGHLEEYRRSRMSPLGIAGGAMAAALQPVLLLLALSLTLALGLSWAGSGPSWGELLAAHLLLAAQALFFAALGLWLAGKLRYPGAAIPVSLCLLAAAICGIWALNPFLRALPKPEDWIYAALLPNPLSAVGSALETDVLRFSWVYERVRAHEYFFVYPPAWQTGGLYLLLSAWLLSLTARRVARSE